MSVRRRLHKLTIWLALVAYMLSGVSPAQPLVICFEPDLSVVLEAAEDGGCTPCGEPEDSSPEVDRSAADCCPCLDIPLPKQVTSPQAKPRVADSYGSWVVALPQPHLATVLRVEPLELAFCASDQPRPPQSLALIRTVILRV